MVFDHRIKQDNGSTRIELTVVIAILAALISLLLPAVQSARESARRTDCIKNTEQMDWRITEHLAIRHQFPDPERAQTNDQHLRNPDTAQQFM